MLASILRSAPTGIGVVEDRVIVSVNYYILQLTGYGREELVGKNARILYPSDADYEYVGTEKYRQIAERGTGSVETRWMRKDGAVLDVLLSSTPLIPENLSAGVVFTVTDITEKNQTAAALRYRTRLFLFGMTALLALQLVLIAALARVSAVRRRVAEDLRSKTVELDRHFSSSLDLLCIADTDGRFLRLNPEWEKVLGYPLGELEGKLFLDLVHPDDRASTIEAISRLDAQNEVLNFQNRYLCKDGSYRRIEWRSKPIGKTIYAVARDVTSRELAEEELRRAYLVVENSPVVLFRWRAEEGWPVAMVSQNVRQFGYEREELISGAVPFASMVHPDDLRRVIEEVQDKARRGVDRFEQEYRLVTRDGRVRWVDDQTAVRRDAEGIVQAYEGILLDITDRKLAEVSLERSLNFQSALLDAVPTAVFYKDREGRYLGCNKVFTEIMGVTSEEIRGRRVHELWPSEMADTYHRKDLELMANPVRQLYEYKIKDGRGVERPVIYTKDVFRDERGEVAGIVGAFLDITERRRAEESLKALNETLEERIRERTRELDELNGNLVRANGELKATLETLHETQDSLVQSEKLAALGQLIAGIAHELNTPFGAIVSSNRSMAELIALRLGEASRAISLLPAEVLEWFNAELASSLAETAPPEYSAGRLRKRRELASRLAVAGRPPSESLLEAILDLGLEENPSIPHLLEAYPEFEAAVQALDTLASIKGKSDIVAVAADKCANVVSALLYYVRPDDEENPSPVAIPDELDGILTLYSNKLKYYSPGN